MAVNLKVLYNYILLDIFNLIFVYGSANLSKNICTFKFGSKF